MFLTDVLAALVTVVFKSISMTTALSKLVLLVRAGTSQSQFCLCSIIFRTVHFHVPFSLGICSGNYAWSAYEDSNPRDLCCTKLFP